MLADAFAIPSDIANGVGLDLPYGTGFSASFSANGEGSVYLRITPILAPAPAPAAAWLFGSGLMALVGMARRKA